MDEGAGEDAERRSRGLVSRPLATRFIAGSNFSLKWANEMCSKTSTFTQRYMDINTFHCQHVDILAV